MKPRILLTGHGGSANRGCQAILVATIRLIRQHVPGCELALISWDPEADQKAAGDVLQGVVVRRRRPRRGLKRRFWKTVASVGRKLRRGFPRFELLANRDLYSWADAVLSIGGDNFTDDYGSPERFFAELAFARRRGAKTVIWGATVGPFRDPREEARWAEELRKVALITAREPHTRDYLRRLGCEENLREVADPAFLLEPDPSRTTTPEKPQGAFRLGLGLSAIVGQYGRGPDHYLACCLEFARAVLREDDAVELLLVPHVRGAAGNDDLAMCQRLASRLEDHRERLVIADPEADARGMKHAIATCDAFIGARTHSTIASLGSLVPTLSIAYSAKAYGLNQQVMGHCDFVVDAREFSAERLLDGWRRLRARLAEIRAHLERRVPELKAMAAQGGAYLRQLLEGK